MKILIWLLLSMQLLPFMTTALIVCARRSGGVRLLIGAACGAAADVLVGELLYHALLSRGLAALNMSMAAMQCSYQTLGRMAWALLLWCAAAWLIGRIAYLILFRERVTLPPRRRALLLMGAALTAIPLLFAWRASAESGSALQIRELGRLDPDAAGASGYVELQNTGALYNEAALLRLSDTEELPASCELRGVVLEPGGACRFALDGVTCPALWGKGGVTLCLTGENGRLLSEVDVPPLEIGESFSLTDGAYALSEPASELLSAPRFSAEAGFYEAPFDLTLTAEDGLVVYYTLDCSVPTTESARYDGAIRVYDRSGEPNLYSGIRNAAPDYLSAAAPDNAPVDKAFVVRAIAADADGNTSEVVTRTYFIGQDKYSHGRTISLVTDPAALFDGADGIYVTGREYDDWYLPAFEAQEPGVDLSSENLALANFEKRGRDWERPAALEIFDGAEPLLSQQVGIRIQGGVVRQSPKKRFSVYARPDYSGSAYFDLDPFGDGMPPHSVALREGWMNAFCMDVAEGRDVAVQRTLPVTVFLDGEYWYDTYMQEKYSEKSLARKYLLNENNIVIVKAGLPNDVEDDSGNAYSDLYSFTILSDLSDPEVFAELERRIDLQSYLDFMCLNIYLGNTDEAEYKNIILWHTVTPEDDAEGDSRWRWALYDMDIALTQTRVTLDDVDTNAQVNSFSTRGLYVAMPFDQQPLFVAMKKSPEFCRRFVLTFMDLVNTTFSEENMSEKLAAWGADLSYDDWFFRDRPQYIVPYLAEEFGLTGTAETVTLSSTDPTRSVKLNTVTLTLSADPDEPWRGIYFTDHPVTVTADEPGFDHWEITAGGKTALYTEPSIEVPVEEGGVDILAVFR